jgi:hypothetical protein
MRGPSGANGDGSRVGGYPAILLGREWMRAPASICAGRPASYLLLARAGRSSPGARALGLTSAVAPELVSRCRDVNGGW